ncbi:MAG: SCO family protein [Spirochaetales bacterium]|nr:SCO family protein [Spirochaetales bacterium]
MSSFLLLSLLDGCNARQDAPSSLDTFGQKSSGTVTEFSAGQFVPGNFTLVNQSGKPESLFDGQAKVTVVSFLYTHCTDTCPFLAIKLQQLYQLLGPQNRLVRIVLVSTDPVRDTPAVLSAYTHELGMDGRWSFLTGSLAQIQPVWKAFKIVVAQSSAADEAETDKNAEALGLTMPVKTGPKPSDGLDPQALQLADQISKKFGGGYEVTHSTPFWIMGPDHSLRATLEADVTAQELKNEVEKILKAST